MSTYDTEKFKMERRKSYMTVLISFTGVMMVMTVLYVQFFQSQKDREFRRLEFDKMQFYMEKQNEQIDRLEKRIEILEEIIQKLRFKEAAFIIENVALSNTNASSRKPIPPAPPQETFKPPVFKKYILPAIYSILGFLLLISAIVALATSNATRKETATEMTKTLMTFFIGAATGQI